MTLLQRTGQRTVPSAWFNGKHVGGSDDVLAGLASGLFGNVHNEQTREFASNAGVKPCGAQDGMPCLLATN